MTKNETAAFDQGRKDKRDGNDELNPYSPLSSLGKLWSAGWDMERQRTIRFIRDPAPADDVQ